MGDRVRNLPDVYWRRLTPELSRAEGVGLNELLGGDPTEGDDKCAAIRCQSLGRPSQSRTD